ncbi:MAG: hypothetical protein H8D45_24540 [Bacteroidetes bacterium]|nr:hypothetical protein [Bacteroidota bacterium]MBL7104496.1 hypothetical protein [Bacteroidales bacterium]
MLLKTKEIFINDASEFIKKFHLENKFIETFGKSIYEWVDNCFMTDEEIICNMLDKLHDKYFYTINHENTGSFVIFKIKD